MAKKDHKHGNYIIESDCTTKTLGFHLRKETKTTSLEIKVRKIKNMSNTINYITKEINHDMIVNNIGDLTPYKKKGETNKKHIKTKIFNRNNFFKFEQWYWEDPVKTLDHNIAKLFDYVREEEIK